jgi:hypothetical protein
MPVCGTGSHVNGTAAFGKVCSNITKSSLVVRNKKLKKLPFSLIRVCYGYGYLCHTPALDFTVGEGRGGKCESTVTSFISLMTLPIVQMADIPNLE